MKKIVVFFANQQIGIRVFLLECKGNPSWMVV